MPAYILNNVWIFIFLRIFESKSTLEKKLIFTGEPLPVVGGAGVRGGRRGGRVSR